jgi:dienelactone hydrolase
VDGVFAKPEGKGPFPAVVILHACGGVLQHVNAGWLDYLKSIGYAALAVDTFGDYAKCPNPLSSDSMLFIKDAYGALDFLARMPDIDADRVAVIGFSIGAVHINNALVPWRMRKPGQRDFRAAIAFYGKCRGVVPPESNFPLLQIVAEKDHYSAGCESWVKPGRLEVRMLLGANHAFDSPQYSGRTDPAGNLMLYSEAATLEARRHARAFLDRHLVPR